MIKINVLFIFFYIFDPSVYRYQATPRDKSHQGDNVSGVRQRNKCESQQKPGETLVRIIKPTHVRVSHTSSRSLTAVRPTQTFLKFIILAAIGQRPGRSKDCFRLVILVCVGITIIFGGAVGRKLDKKMGLSLSSYDSFT